MYLTSEESCRAGSSIYQGNIIWGCICDGNPKDVSEYVNFFSDNSVTKAYSRASVFLTQICKDVLDIFIFNVSKKLYESPVCVKCVLGKCQYTGKETFKYSRRVCVLSEAHESCLANLSLGHQVPLPSSTLCLAREETLQGRWVTRILTAIYSVSAACYFSFQIRRLR